MKKLIIITAVLFLSLSACKKEEEAKMPDFVDIESKAQLDENIAEGVSMIFYHASWCSICKEQRPFVQDAAKLESLESVYFAQVEFDDHKEITTARDVNSFPVIVVYKNGVEQTRLNGKGHDVAKLEALLKTYL